MDAQVQESLQGIASTSGLELSLVEGIYAELLKRGDLMSPVALGEIDFFCCFLYIFTGFKHTKQ